MTMALARPAFCWRGLFIFLPRPYTFKTKWRAEGRKRTGGGGGAWVQWVEAPLPAVLSIQSGINKVRYATMKGIIAAKKKPTLTVAKESLGVTVQTQKRI